MRGFPAPLTLLLIVSAACFSVVRAAVFFLCRVGGGRKKTPSPPPSPPPALPDALAAKRALAPSLPCARLFSCQRARMSRISPISVQQSRAPAASACKSFIFPPFETRVHPTRHRGAWIFFSWDPRLGGEMGERRKVIDKRAHTQPPPPPHLCFLPLPPSGGARAR